MFSNWNENSLSGAFGDTLMAVGQIVAPFVDDEEESANENNSPSPSYHIDQLNQSSISEQSLSEGNDLASRMEFDTSALDIEPIDSESESNSNDPSPSKYSNMAFPSKNTHGAGSMSVEDMEMIISQLQDKVSFLQDSLSGMIREQDENKTLIEDKDQQINILKAKYSDLENAYKDREVENRTHAFVENSNSKLQSTASDIVDEVNEMKRLKKEYELNIQNKNKELESNHIKIKAMQLQIEESVKKAELLPEALQTVETLQAQVLEFRKAAEFEALQHKKHLEEFNEFKQSRINMEAELKLKHEALINEMQEKYEGAISNLKEELRVAAVPEVCSNAHTSDSTDIQKSEEYMLLQQEYYQMEERNLQYEIEIDTLKQENEYLKADIARYTSGSVVSGASTSSVNVSKEETSPSAALAVDTIALNDKVIELQTEIFECNDQIEKHISSIKERDATIQSHKTRVTNLEAENKQLQVIITQLRSNRRNTRDESESVLNERNALKDMIDVYKKEIASLQEGILKNEEETSIKMRNVENETRKELKLNYNRLMLDYNDIKSKYEVVKGQLSSVEKDCRAYKHDASVLTADNALLKSELKSQEVQYSNTRSVIANIEEDFKSKVAILEKQHNHEQVNMKSKFESQCASFQEEMLEKEKKWKEEVSALDEKVETERLLRRKMELDINKERKKMEVTLSNALKQVNNTNLEELVDRTLIGNLIVSYIQRRRSLEVMRLIAGICNFNDDQLVTVGLKVPPAPSIQLPAPGKLISSLYGAFVGGDTGKSNTSTGNAANRLDSHNGRQRPTPLEGDNLSELWVNFLLQESDNNNPLGTNNTGSKPEEASDLILRANNELISEMKSNPDPNPNPISVSDKIERGRQDHTTVNDDAEDEWDVPSHIEHSSFDS